MSSLTFLANIHCSHLGDFADLFLGPPSFVKYTTSPKIGQPCGLPDGILARVSSWCQVSHLGFLEMKIQLEPTSPFLKSDLKKISVMHYPSSENYVFHQNFL